MFGGQRDRARGHINMLGDNRDGTGGHSNLFGVHIDGARIVISICWMVIVMTLEVIISNMLGAIWMGMDVTCLEATLMGLEVISTCWMVIVMALEVRCGPAYDIKLLRWSGSYLPIGCDQNSVHS